MRQHKSGSIPLEYTESELRKLKRGEKIEAPKRREEKIEVIEVGSRRRE